MSDVIGKLSFIVAFWSWLGLIGSVSAGADRWVVICALILIVSAVALVSALIWEEL